MSKFVMFFDAASQDILFQVDAFVLPLAAVPSVDSRVVNFCGAEEDRFGVASAIPPVGTIDLLTDSTNLIRVVDSIRTNTQCGVWQAPMEVDPHAEKMAYRVRLQWSNTFSWVNAKTVAWRVDVLSPLHAGAAVVDAVSAVSGAASANVAAGDAGGRNSVRVVDDVAVWATAREAARDATGARLRGAAFPP